MQVTSCPVLLCPQAAQNRSDRVRAGGGVEAGGGGLRHAQSLTGGRQATRPWKCSGAAEEKAVQG